MKEFANIATQAEMDVCPRIIGATLDPTWEQLREAGFRRLVSEDTVPEGYRAIAWRYDDIDGDTCHKTLVSSINIAEEQAAEEEARRQAEIARQLNKPLKLKTVENGFLTFCDQLTSTTTHAKLGFADLNTIIGQIPDQMTAAGIAIRLLAIDAEGKREGGLQWWDDCVWHQEIV